MSKRILITTIILLLFSSIFIIAKGSTDSEIEAGFNTYEIIAPFESSDVTELDQDAVVNWEIQVVPHRNVIYNGELTTINIDLHHFDSEGQKIQGFREGVLVEINGVIDGTVTPGSGKYILDGYGIGYIEYRAGEKDKQIRITAIFEPGGGVIFRDEATITIKPLEYEATLTIKGSYTKTQHSSDSKEYDNGTHKEISDLKEIEAASFYVPLKMERADDVPMFNQRWEYYRPLDINLTSCNISYRYKKFNSSSYKTNHGFEQTLTRDKNPERQEIAGKETLQQHSNIILVIDKETNKVVKIVTGGYGVDFYWNEREKITGYSWDEDGKKPINYSRNKTDDISTYFGAEPVEDPIPDPTVKSVAQSVRTYLKNLGTPLPVDIEIPEDEDEKAEIPPDLLVEFGDGKTFFGGDGKKVIDNSKGSTINRQEWVFNWQVTRKKKPL